MKKIISILLFLFCLSNSYAQKPIAIYRVKSFNVNFEGRWSTGEYKGMIFLYEDKIVNRSDTGEAEFIIAGKVENFNDSDGIKWVTFECLNEDLDACIIAFTYSKEFRRRCMYIMYTTHQVCYIIKDDDEY